MKKTLFKFSFLLITLVTALPVTAITPNHLLTADKIKLLKVVNSKIVVPTYIPKGFVIESVISRIDRDGIGGGASYQINYSNNQQSFTIESTTGGIGDISGDTQVSEIKNPLFGTIYYNYFKPDSNGSAYSITDWVGKGPFFHFISPAKDSIGDKIISKTEAIKVIKSLVYLK